MSCCARPSFANDSPAPHPAFTGVWAMSRPMDGTRHNVARPRHEPLPGGNRRDSAVAADPHGDAVAVIHGRRAHRHRPVNRPAMANHRHHAGAENRPPAMIVIGDVGLDPRGPAARTVMVHVAAGMIPAGFGGRSGKESGESDREDGNQFFHRVVFRFALSTQAPADYSRCPGNFPVRWFQSRRSFPIARSTDPRNPSPA